MNYEQRRKQEVKETLRQALEDRDFDKFETEYRDHALRYLAQCDREPLMRTYLNMRSMARRSSTNNAE